MYVRSFCIIRRERSRKGGALRNYPRAGDLNRKLPIHVLIELALTLNIINQIWPGFRPASSPNKLRR